MDLSTLYFIPVTGLPEIGPGDSLAGLLVQALEERHLALEDGDVLVVTSKIVAKNEGRVVDLSTVRPGRRARALAAVVRRDARELEIMLANGGRFLGAVSAELAYRRLGNQLFGRTGQETEKALKRMPTLLFFARGGQLNTEAGIDASNVPGAETIALLPQDPHASARRLAAAVEARTGKKVAVIISDSEIRLIRPGSQDIGIGWWGIRPLRPDFGRADRHGLAKFGGVDHIVDALTAAAALLMGQTDESIPVVLVRGVPAEFLQLGEEPGPAAAEVEQGSVGNREQPPAGVEQVSLIAWGVWQLFWSRVKWRLVLLNPFFR